MKRIALLIVSLLVLLAACAPAATVPANDGGDVPTDEAVRMLNLDTVLTGMPPTAIPPTFTPAPTPTPFPTFTPRPTASAPSSDSASPTPSCTNIAEFIKHLSVSDNTLLSANQTFAKIWQIKNIGTCTWTTAYQLVFITGQAFNGPATMALSAETPPGATIDLRLNLTTPAETGAFVGSWMLQAPDGSLFGVGSDGSQPISVSIVTKPPTPAPPS